VDLSNYIGVPYRKMNCYDLVKEFYIREMGIEFDYSYGLPDLLDRQMLIKAAKGDFVKVDKPYQVGDIVVIKLNGFEAHIGVMVDRRRFLHTMEKTDSIIDSLAKWDKLCTGVFRWNKDL